MLGSEDGGVEASRRIERLLTEMRGAVSPLAAQRLDELVTALVELYGRALGRMLDAIEPARRPELAGDELVGSLLVLHGLHPLPVEARARAALDELAPQLGRLELVALEDGMARVRAVDAPAVAGARELIALRLEEAAPEIARLEVEGLRAPTTKGGLVQIDVHRARARDSEGA